jgi:hypothetical protein
VVLGGLAADLGIRARAEPAGEVATDVELDVRVGHQQRLRIGVDRDELHAAQTRVDHAVDGVDAAAADPDDLDHGQVVGGVRRHGSSCRSSSAGRPIAWGSVRRSVGMRRRESLDLK